MKNIPSRKIIFVAATLSALFIMLFSCTKEIGVIPAAPVPPPPGACDTITYSKHIGAIVQANCVSCHGAVNPSGNLPLTTYDQVKVVADNGKLHGVISVGPPQFKWMPDGSQGLPQPQRDLIECWINNGKKQ